MPIHKSNPIPSLWRCPNFIIRKKWSFLPNLLPLLANPKTFPTQESASKRSLLFVTRSINSTKIDIHFTIEPKKKNKWDQYFICFSLWLETKLLQPMPLWFELNLLIGWNLSEVRTAFVKLGVFVFFPFFLFFFLWCERGENVSDLLVFYKGRLWRLYAKILPLRKNFSGNKMFGQN